MEVVQTIGRYEIRGTLGRGAMGVVHDGFDPVIGRRVAIKTVRLPDPDDPEAVEAVARFRRESQAAGRLTHPNIVGVFDYGESGDLAFIVMEFVDGPTIKSLLDKGERFTLPAVRRIMDDVLAGLQFSHDRGVVHRDVKPANIMLTAEGQAKIADFGIARIESSSMTQVGTVLGTPAFMSPEQFMGLVADHRSDIYSAGVLLYLLLTGDRPFDGGFSTIMHKALNTDPPRPSQVALTVPGALDPVVLRAMAKRPEDRFASAGALAEAIRGAMAAPVPVAAEAEATLVIPAAAPAKAPSRETASSRTTVLPIALSAGLAILAGIGGGAWWLRQPPAGPAVTPAPPVKPAVVELPAPVVQVPPPAPESVPVLPPKAPSAPPLDVPALKPPALAPPALAPPALAPAALVPPALVPSAKLPPLAPPVEKKAEVKPPPIPLPMPAVAVVPKPVSEAVLRQALASAPCAAATASAAGQGAVVVTGLAGSEIAELRQRLAGLANPRPLDWRVVGVDAVFCDALGAMRAAAPDADPPKLSLRGGRTALRDGERIEPSVTMPGFGGELRVDYLVHDGSLVHLYPTVADPAQHAAAVSARALNPGERLSLGDGAGGQPTWEVGPPYGIDMILAVASSAPLQTPPAPQNAVDTGAGYLRALQTAIEAARAKGVRVGVRALPIQTLPK